MVIFIIFYLLASGQATKMVNESENVAVENISREQDLTSEDNGHDKKHIESASNKNYLMDTAVPIDLLPTKAFELSTENYIIKDLYNFGNNDHENNETSKRTQGEIPRPKQKLRIIFIRSPMKKVITNQMLALKKGNSMQREMIYVLKKQPDQKKLMDKLQNLDTHVDHKTLVYFLNYRKSRNAQRAQKKILRYYDSVGGKLQRKFSGTIKALSLSTGLENDMDSSSSSAQTDQ